MDRVRCDSDLRIVPPHLPVSKKPRPRSVKGTRPGARSCAKCAPNRDFGRMAIKSRKPVTIEITGFFVARRKGFEPLTFWSVGCLKGKSESFRLRFVLFATVRSTNFPLFPSRPPRSNSVLGQKWVKKDFIITNWN